MTVRDEFTTTKSTSPPRIMIKCTSIAQAGYFCKGIIGLVHYASDNTLTCTRACTNTNDEDAGDDDEANHLASSLHAAALQQLLSCSDDDDGGVFVISSSSPTEAGVRVSREKKKQRRWPRWLQEHRHGTPSFRRQRRRRSGCGNTGRLSITATGNNDQ
mmetsp:Transcript_6128/g.13423  ORF Transcript_6128/g.13423 Transcript_6128/m.13423 type:complete len:159 (+) Transcript_6128:29-505(+)